MRAQAYCLDSKAIQEMLPIIDPEEDYLTIVAAEEKIAASEAKRKKELDDIHGNLKCARCRSSLMVRLTNCDN